MHFLSFISTPMRQAGRLRTMVLLAAGLLFTNCLWAQAPAPSSISDPFVITLLIIMAFLALIIGLLAYIVLGSAELYLEKEKAAGREESTADKPEKKNQVAGNAVIVSALLLVGLPSMAQDNNGYKLSDTAFYMMSGVIFVELVVIGALLYNLRLLLDIRSKRKPVATRKVSLMSFIGWWEKLNRFKPAEEEAAIDLGHSYDGIRELDNRLPPWWLYGFYACIIFSVVYLWRYHVSHSAPLSGEEYQLAVQDAAVKRAAYLVKAANNVDESTVQLLSSASDLGSGQKIFETACFACHGKQGEGGVGPNLTDGYWLHGGSVQAIFKTIKYGVAEKGMKSWKDDYSPAQIAQLASYIHSLKGTNPPNGKAPQGTIFKESATGGSDSAMVAPDSTDIAAPGH